ncbi:MAG: response regulator [Acinetobacter sp.]
MKQVIKPRLLLAFQIWFKHLGYVVKDNGQGFIAKSSNRFIKKRLQYVRVDSDLGGNQAAYQLAEEFEEHLVSPLSGLEMK